MDQDVPLGNINRIVPSVGIRDAHDSHAYFPILL